MKARLTPCRAGEVVTGLFWALAAALGVDFVAVLIIFGTGP